ncbi:MAG: hypothetical protein OEZ47_16850, partial [Gammaproteobacteria bacterium]|nr:hypothetical protein [Gammaproteobacteria bacterium]
GCSDPGKLTQRVSRIEIFTDAGALEATRYFFYAESGRLEKVRLDKVGISENLYHYNYDEKGKLTSIVRMPEDPAELVDIYLVFYSSENKISRIEGKERDTDELYYTEYYEYSQTQNVVKTRYELYNPTRDGEIIEYLYDADKLVFSFSDVSETIYNYDSEGLKENEMDDRFRDGSVDKVRRYYYEKGDCIPMEPISLLSSYCIQSSLFTNE